MCSAHCLTERNLSVRFYKKSFNIFRGYGADTNCRVNHMAMKCDHDLESV